MDPLEQWPSTFLASEAGFLVEEIVSMDGGEQGGMVSGGCKCFTFTMHFISSVITSAPPEIIRRWILEAGHPCPRAPAIGSGPQCQLLGVEWQGSLEASSPGESDQVW